MSNQDYRHLLKHSCHRWALSNYGNVWGTYKTRKEAIREAEIAIGTPWKHCKHHMEVQKVTISEGWS